MLRTIKSLLLATGLCALSVTTSHAQVDVSITVAPPELRVVDQPNCPVEDYLWTPGYWSYGPAGYYWVDGVWVAPPRVGFLWTPGYWGFADGVYAFHTGYWGPSIGFYGGVNYGYGYFGHGYVGGGWQGNVFRYNTAVSRVNTTVIHNTYVDNHVTEHVTDNHVSFNGRGGIADRPSAEERRAASAEHLPPVGEQTARRDAASHDHNALAPNQPRPEGTVGGRFPGHGGQGGTSQASRDAALSNLPYGEPQFPGGQGGTSKASRAAALANQRQQDQEPEPRAAERQPAREAGAEHTQAPSRRENQPQPERVRPPGSGEQAHAKPAPKPPREGNGHENKKEEKRP